MHFRISYTMNTEDIFRSSIGCEIMLIIKARIRLIFSRYTTDTMKVVAPYSVNTGKNEDIADSSSLFVLFCLFDFILYVHSTIFQLCGTVLPGFNQY